MLNLVDHQLCHAAPARPAPYNQVLNMWSFWIMTSAMAFMTFTLTFAGVVQVHLQRVMGLTYMEVQDQLALFYWMRLGAGMLRGDFGAACSSSSMFGPGRVSR